MVHGIVAMGLPVFDARGAVAAGISVGIPVSRFGPAEEQAIARPLREAAAAISRRLGWTGAYAEPVPLRRPA